MTSDETAVQAAIHQYFDSRSRVLAPVSTARAVAEIARVLGDDRPTDRELTDLVARYALRWGIAISFDGVE